jgi:hypothetical protein
MSGSVFVLIVVRATVMSHMEQTKEDRSSRFSLRNELGGTNSRSAVRAMTQVNE